MTDRTPLIVAAVLLLLPVLYVASYLALVDPPDMQKIFRRMWDDRSVNYRTGGKWLDSFFLPLEQIDRKVRPGQWELLPWETSESRSGMRWKRWDPTSP